MPLSLNEYLPPLLNDKTLKVISVAYDNTTAASKSQKFKVTVVLEGSDEEPSASEEKECEKKVESKQEQKETKGDSPKKGVSLIPSQRDEDLISCDGPCGKMHHPNNLHSMGRCDHYICQYCFDLVSNTDGSVGCSAFRCVTANFLHWMSKEDAQKAYDKYIRETERAREKEMRARSSQEGSGKTLVEKPSLSNMSNVVTTKSSSTTHTFVKNKSSEVASKKAKRTSSKSDSLISDACLSTAVRVRGFVFNARMNNAEVEKVFTANSTMERVAMKLGRKAFSDFSLTKGVRVFYSPVKSLEPMNCLVKEQLKKTVGELQSEKRTLYVVIDQTCAE